MGYVVCHNFNVLIVSSISMCTEQGGCKSLKRSQFLRKLRHSSW